MIYFVLKTHVYNINNLFFKTKMLFWKSLVCCQFPNWQRFLFSSSFFALFLCFTTLIQNKTNKQTKQDKKFYMFSFKLFNLNPLPFMERLKHACTKPFPFFYFFVFQFSKLNALTVFSPIKQNTDLCQRLRYVNPPFSSPCFFFKR